MPVQGLAKLNRSCSLSVSFTAADITELHASEILSNAADPSKRPLLDSRGTDSADAAETSLCGSQTVSQSGALFPHSSADLCAEIGQAERMHARHPSQ